jgi:wobble nucleotide-excising tRNase
LKLHSDAKKAPLFQLYKKKYSSKDKTKEHEASMITFKGLLRFLKDYLFEDFEPSFLPADLDFHQMERFLVYLILLF